MKRTFFQTEAAVCDRQGFTGEPNRRSQTAATGIVIAIAAFFLIAGTARCDEDQPQAASVQIKHGANGESIVTLDETMWQRLGLKIAALSPLHWQPQMRVIGRVADPFALTAAVADLEAARAAADASQRDFERTQKLADQDNASARTFETAKAAAARDQFAFKSARAKFISDWGTVLAARTNLSEFAGKLCGGEGALVRLNLPAGTIFKTPPATAKVSLFNHESDPVNAEFAGDLGVDPATQSQTLLFSVTNGTLPPGAAVSAILKISDATDGVVIPSAAVVRHEDRGWVYLETGANDFERHEVSLAQPVDGGFFEDQFSTTNKIIVTGAQTVLSAELSGGNFNTGVRD